ncbi:MAG TPA: hypothetical protein VMI75_35395 [Polyangiaceae bacterium]|nr:hypothetical protein [Polyangiaceae bacterium]
MSRSGKAIRGFVAAGVLGAWSVAALLACGGSAGEPAGGPDAAEAASEVGPDGTDDTGPGTDTGAPADATAVDVRDGGQDASGDGGVPDVYVDASGAVALCNGMFDAGSQSFDSCCSAADKTTKGYGYIHSSFAEGLTFCNTNLTGSLAKGRIAIDAVQSAACIAAIQSALASSPLCWPSVWPNRLGSLPPQLTPAACASPVVGLQQVGDPCFQDYECATGLTCVGWAASADGTCQQPPAVGEACGLTCDGGGSGAITYFYPFGPHPGCAAGAYCGVCSCEAQGGADASCGGAGSCQGSLVCVDQYCSAGGYGMAGAPCSGDPDCVDGTWCDYRNDGGTPTCQPRETAGGPCEFTGFPDSCLGSCEPSGDAGACVAICGSM